MTVKILPELEALAVPIGEVTGWPGNPRRGDLPKIKESLTEHGQYAALLVQKSSGYVIKGNNTLAAMRELGAQRVAVQVLDIEDDRAKRILAMDNASSDDADYDKRLMAELLADFADDLAGTGWDVDKLDDLLLELGDAAAELESLAAPQTLPAPPTTDATYAETPEDEQARRDRKAAMPAPNKVAPMTEIILVLTEDDRAEALALIAAGREWLGAELRQGEVVLRGLRTLAAVGDSRHNIDATIAVASLVKAAGADAES